jgi:hypothetical protein
MLRSQKHTEAVRVTVEEAFHVSDLGTIHPEALAVFEHGHWWIDCGPCGAQWDAVDAAGSDSIGGFSFEQVSLGDGFCEEETNNDNPSD